MTTDAPALDKGMGWLPQPPDIRDYRFGNVLPLTALPPSWDLRPKLPPIQDQGQLGACTAFASTALYRYLLKKQGQTDEDSAELFVYYEARKRIGTVAYDSGAYIRDAVKVMATNGVPPEQTWPYNISRFTEQPPQPAYVAGESRQALVYEAVPIDHQAIKSALVQDLPVVFGFTVYSSFMGQQCLGATGVMPMPQPGESVVGGHAVCFVGYDDARSWYIVRNSWSPAVHDRGYFYMPYAYVNAGLCSDAWIVRSVEGYSPPVPTGPVAWRVVGSSVYHTAKHIRAFNSFEEAQAAGYRPHSTCG